MKKIISILLGVMLIASSAFAADITLSPGAEIDIVINKDVMLDNTGTKGELSAQYYLSTCEIGFGDNVRITPKIGIVKSVFETDQYGPEITADNEIGLAFGVAAEVDIYTFTNTTGVDVADYLNGLTLTAIGEYRYSKTELDSVDFGGIEIDNPIRNDVSFHTWEIGGKISKQFDYLSAKPYFGLVYSDLSGKYDFNLSALNLNEDVEADCCFGIRTGVSVQPVDNLTLCLDLSFVDETSIGLSGKYRF